MISAFLDYLKRAKEAEIAAHAAHERCKQFVLDTKYNMVWNEAIEAAAKRMEQKHADYESGAEIRKLKR